MVWRGCGVLAGEIDMSAGSPSVAVASALASSASAWAQACSKVRGSTGSRVGVRVRRRSSVCRVHIGPRRSTSSRDVGSSHTSSGASPSLYHHSKLSISIRGAPLGLANKHLLALYPQTARRLARAQTGKPSQHSTLFLVFEIFIECCDGLGGSHAANVTKGLSSLSHLEGYGDLDAAEVLLVGLVVAGGIEVAKIEGIADGLECMFVHAGDDSTDALGLIRHTPAAHA